MALQFSGAVRDAQNEAIETTIGTSPSLIIYSGAVAANCAAADPSGVLATITLPSDWSGASSGGVKALAGTWSVAASGTGTAASFRIKSSGGTCHAQGTVGMGSGDLSLVNTSIAATQTVTVTSFSLTAGNA